jgi:hypothetical protein
MIEIMADGRTGNRTVEEDRAAIVMQVDGMASQKASHPLVPAGSQRTSRIGHAFHQDPRATTLAPRKTPWHHGQRGGLHLSAVGAGLRHVPARELFPH